ncbi:Non-specific lipid-transfer protein [Hondaea fermentalgiana]|uniref:Non-specific lipid-transfer protein n=1 Tax=Hondaea fermentalgiana TaxID=2315210 RepID=A0A2R5G4H2_9STRA|nr:Non-specific lipid-transfer protein [Hondaea fermentalgiana]|eukprot:GBG25209.1 Non-specific lipid-transfer protein [Hondaea fermentalgiana]
MPRLAQTVRVVGCGATKLGNRLGRSAGSLMAEAVQGALSSARLELDDLDGLIAVPSMSDPHLMEAHYLATKIGLLPKKNFLVRTIDTGGAGPVTALLEGRRMIEAENCQAVVIAAGDAVSSLSTEEFLRRADAGIGCDRLPSPAIPNGYGLITDWHAKTYGVTREQLAKVPCLMSHQASKHPHAITRRRYTVEEVLESPQITPQLNLLECARRMDGAGAIIVASSRFLEKRGLLNKGNHGNGDVVILSGGEASGPLSPPVVIDETMFSCEQAAQSAYYEAQVRPDEIDFFGLYDCFPICFLRAIEAVGICPKGQGGRWIDEQYERILADENYVLPVNTHGGLLSFGAPWEAPAIFAVIEAVRQLNGVAGAQQVAEDCRRALVYGNGGIFSSSAVAILSKPIQFNKTQAAAGVASSPKL